MSYITNGHEEVRGNGTQHLEKDMWILVSHRDMVNRAKPYRIFEHVRIPSVPYCDRDHRRQRPKDDQLGDQLGVCFADLEPKWGQDESEEYKDG